MSLLGLSLSCEKVSGVSPETSLAVQVQYGSGRNASERITHRLNACDDEAVRAQLLIMPSGFPI